MKKALPFLIILVIALVVWYRNSAQQPSGPQGVKIPRNAVPLIFTYGSEKEQWITEVTNAFNAEGHKIASGKTIFVQAIPKGSGECIDTLLSGEIKADIISPASAAFITMGNARSRVATGKDLLGPTENLVLSPVVIAMWKPMAQALGWGKKPVGWSDILPLAKNPKGWAVHGHPEWGAFKFGHTHPEYSNSGLIALLAEMYAASGKVKGLTRADVNTPKAAAFLGSIEKSIVHYGSSTGFFGHKMFDNGPRYLSAAVLYENMVIEANAPGNTLQQPVVAIYPKEGTFWSDHPAGIVQRPWVTPEKQEAAKAYLQYLLAEPQQRKAMASGFRPADVNIALGAPLESARGIDPQEPKTTLEVPSADVMTATLDLWRKYKKHANVVLALDTSGSMGEEGKLVNARTGADGLLDVLDPADIFSLISFNTDTTWMAKGALVGPKRADLKAQIDGLIAAGNTSLYDTISDAYHYLQAHPQPDKISALIVLTDGADTCSKTQLANLLTAVTCDSETKTIRVFTIGYGKDANKAVLKQIADVSQAKAYDGTTANIRDVFKDIATFF